MSELAELARRRGFFFQSEEAYGGVAGFYTYGPAGAALKRNVEDAWRERFAVGEGHVEIDAPTIMPEAVFEASGHLDGFDDVLVACETCEQSHRADHLVEDNTEFDEAESFSAAKIAELISENDISCPACGDPLAGQEIQEFNLMFETAIGPGSTQSGYLRPETAQGIFVEFPRLKEYARGQLPFGVTQIGRAYRNEISPRKAIVRVREFTQAELETFVGPEDQPEFGSVADVELPLYPVETQGTGEYVHLTVAEALEDGVIKNEWIAYYLGMAYEFYEQVGVDLERFRFRQHQPEERSHYAADCWDAESEVAGDWVEIAGFADRGSYDLSKHAEHTDESFTVFEQYEEPRRVERPTVDPDMGYLGPEFGGRAGDVASALESLADSDPEAFDSEAVTVEVDGEQHSIPVEHTGFAIEEQTEAGEHVMPQVIEPSFGVGRTVYTVLAHALEEDEVDGEPRRVLSIPAEVASTFVGVFPLMDKDGLGERARSLAADLREAGLSVTYDDSGNIGRRYRRQDEVGTPFCLTVDYQTLEDGTVTIRERDSTEQRRVPTGEALVEALDSIRDGAASFAEISGSLAEQPATDPSA